MRISTNHYRNQAIGNLSTQQAQLAHMQEQASTGRKVNRASDDPLATAEAERLRSQMARSDIEQRMISYAKGIMAQTQDIMGDSINALQEARDTMIAAGDGILSDSDRKDMATKLEMVRKELYLLANVKDLDGNYVFGGPGTEGGPLGAEADPMYQGAAGSRTTGMRVQYGL
ncbi:MAG: flagellar hook-associated protein FlgL, partial [Lautropia sp.]|nr:flagellar hook-associated protein FlgL [Lautropia sp.]